MPSARRATWSWGAAILVSALVAALVAGLPAASPGSGTDGAARGGATEASREPGGDDRSGRDDGNDRRASSDGAGERGDDRADPVQHDVLVVVMDDVSMDLVPTMARLRELAARGASYTSASVVNSLCCPSRAATFTGQPPHLNGVLTNTSGGPLDAKGGWEAFRQHDGPARSYNAALDDAGYRTGFVGKFLNEYEPRRTALPTGTTALPPPRVPGWDDFEALSGGAYDGWGFYRTTGPHAGALGLEHHPPPPLSASPRVRDRSYAGTVIADRAVRLAKRYEAGDRPYLLHVAPYAAHARNPQPVYPGEPVFPPAMRDRPGVRTPDGNCGALPCADLGVDDLPGYADDPDDNRPVRLDDAARATEAPGWRPERVRLTQGQVLQRLRDRARMVQSVDRMLDRLLRVVGPDTYVVVTSDNGFHLGQHGLDGGKGTPYASDTAVPLVVAGPGVVPGTRGQQTSNLDLAPTLEELAGLDPEPWRVGRSLVPSLRDPGAAGQRYTFAEHRQGPVLPGEPDGDVGSGGRLDAIPSYTAVRSERGLLVRLDLARDWREKQWAWELYPAGRPYEVRNEFARLHDRPWVRDLRRRAVAWTQCRPAQCRRLQG